MAGAKGEAVAKKQNTVHIRLLDHQKINELPASVSDYFLVRCGACNAACRL